MALAAEDIYQHFLDVTASTLMSGHFDEVADAMIYPHTMETLDGHMYFETPSQMVEAARDFHAHLMANQSADYFRLCKSAAFVQDRPDKILGTHETYILRGGTYVVEPYRNEMTLELDGDRWKGAGIRAHVSNVDLPILSPRQLRARAMSRPTDIGGPQND